MAERISRTKLARYAADKLVAGDRAVIREVAAYLVDSKRVRETDLVVRAIYDELEARGIVIADVTTAHQLDESVKAALEALTGAKQLAVREYVDPDVLGGVRVSTATRVLDATLKNRLMKLRERKV